MDSLSQSLSYTASKARGLMPAHAAPIRPEEDEFAPSPRGLPRSLTITSMNIGARAHATIPARWVAHVWRAVAALAGSVLPEGISFRGALVKKNKHTNSWKSK